MVQNWLEVFDAVEQARPPPPLTPTSAGTTVQAAAPVDGDGGSVAPELDWLLDNHTLSEPMRVPNGWFRKALVDHVCSLPGLSCEGRRKPLPELPITVDGSDKPRGVVRMFEGAGRCMNQSFTAPSCVHSTPST